VTAHAEKQSASSTVYATDAGKNTKDSGRFLHVKGREGGVGGDEKTDQPHPVGCGAFSARTSDCHAFPAGSFKAKLRRLLLCLLFCTV